MKILIVDDSPLMHDIIEDTLTPIFVNCQLKGASNGLEAVKILEQWVPDLILTDWDMPEMNGPELIKRIRQKESFQDIPIMMITGYMVTAESLKEAFDLGVSDFLRKPFNETELIARVKSLLLLSKSVKELKEQNEIILEHARFVGSLVSAIPLPLVYYTTEGIVVNCNARFLESFNLTIQQVIGASIYQICPMHHQLKKLNDEMVSTGKSQIEFEGSINLPITGMTDFLVTNTLYYNPMQKTEGIIMAMSDISALKASHKISIDEKKRELVASAMRLIQTNQKVENLIDDLLLLEKHIDREGKAVIGKLSSKYKLGPQDSSWKEFEIRFGKVYEEFYQTLNQLYQSITPSEKKLCALLRLNLTSKEIAALTFQDAKSVDMARYRLRKKLNLKPDENLVEYLMRI